MGYTYSHLPPSKSAPRKPKNVEIFSVGWHAFVNWPQPAGGPSAPVPMTDGAGKPIPNDLVDGQEVEIISWRPRAREGAMYQVRRRIDGSEWWIPATYLRQKAQAPTPTEGPL